MYVGLLWWNETSLWRYNAAGANCFWQLMCFFFHYLITRVWEPSVSALASGSVLRGVLWPANSSKKSAFELLTLQITCTRLVILNRWASLRLYQAVLEYLHGVSQSMSHEHRSALLPCLVTVNLIRYQARWDETDQQHKYDLVKWNEHQSTSSALFCFTGDCIDEKPDASPA